MFIDGNDDEESGGLSDLESRARTYLANERTFLAWFRTGLTLVALGLASAQFLTRDLITGVPLRRAIAAGFVVSGVVVTLTGASRYFQGNREIAVGRFKPPVYSVVMSTALMVIVGVVAVGFIVLLR
jgi:putative membrane protein